MAYEFRCTDAGATCRGHFVADSEEELLRKVGDHLKEKHKIQNVSKTLQNYALQVAKQR